MNAIDWFDDQSDEEVYGGDTDEEDNDVCESSDHDSESEQEAEEDEIDVSNNTQILWGKDKKTMWNTACRKKSKTKKHNIFVKKPGPIDDAKNANSISDCFKIFITDSLIEIITECTNVYIEQIKKNYSRERDAKSTDTNEMKALLGLLYFIGLFKSGRQNIKDLWKTDGTGVDIIYCTMSYNRFGFLLRCIRFDNINDRKERKKIDKLAPIRNIFNIFVENCRKAIVPGPHLTIDEQLVAFRGRCPFRQYIPSKPARYGLKVFALVDSETMYTVNLEIYPGTQPDGPYKLSNSALDVVKRLAEVVKGTWRNITIDNWFTSVPLALELKKEFQLTMLGTIRKNKREIPPELITIKGREEKSSKFAFNRDCTLVSYMPKKKKIVLVLSTTHDDDRIDDDTKKPMMVIDYNNTKYGVDVVDQLCGSYDVARNCRRWPLTIFYNIMNIGSINSMVLYHLNNKEQKIKRRDFIRTLAIGLMKPEMERRYRTESLPKQIRTKIGFILDLPSDQISSKNVHKTGTGRCYICPRKEDKKTRNICVLCGKWVCKEHQEAMIKCMNCKNDDNDE